MTEDHIPFTAAAYQKMQARQAFLIELRKEVVERLRVAREMGDLSENGAYRYAKFELGNIGRELRQLNYLLEHGRITQKISTTVIGFGNTVTLQDDASAIQYTLVSEHESDPAQQKLSMKSPLGEILLGKKANEEVEITTPRGKRHYKIIAVK